MFSHTGTIRSTDAVAARQPRRLPFLVAIGAHIVALVVFTASPHAVDYPVAALGIGAFLLVHLLLPACRPVWETPLCPGNIAQAFFWVQLVVVPLLIVWTGVHEGTLPYVPSAATMQTAIGLRVVGYLAYCVAYQLAAGRPNDTETTRQGDKANEQPASLSTCPSVSASSFPGTLFLTAAFLGIGLIGQCLTYRSLADFVEFASSPAMQREREALPTTLAGAAGTFLRPFLGFGLVLLWSWWLHRGDRPRRVLVIVFGTAILVAMLLVANFSYNRGSMIVPVVAVVAAFSIHVRRVPFVVVGAAAAVALFAVLAFGWYRGTDLEVNDLATSDVHESWSEDQIVEFFEIYASGPQMTAYLIEQRGDAPLYRGRTLVSSVMCPVPILGKSFRDDSGVSVLNALIYQDPEIADQIIAYDAELYINFHVPGVILGYALVGWLLRCFQQRFLRAPRAVESYAWLTLAVWTVFPGSLPVISQMCVFFFWPIYGYFAFQWISSAYSHAPADVDLLRGLCRK
jgi:Ca2+/Na+ antiporter